MAMVVRAISGTDAVMTGWGRSKSLLMRDALWKLLRQAKLRWCRPGSSSTQESLEIKTFKFKSPEGVILQTALLPQYLLIISLSLTNQKIIQIKIWWWDEQACLWFSSALWTIWPCENAIVIIIMIMIFIIILWQGLVKMAPMIIWHYCGDTDDIIGSNNHVHL